ncbi:MAG: hypothetical protein MJ137_05745 [Clostridia bacterium]|nr:hypothetical protein [Clostridia bacterium]
MKNGRKFFVTAAAILLTAVMMLSACDLNITVDPEATLAPADGTTGAPVSTSPEAGTTSPSDTTGAPDTTTDAGTDAPATTVPAGTDAPGTEPAAPAMPTGAELEKAIAALFSTQGFNGILFTDFGNAKDINLWQVVAQSDDKSFTGNIEDVYKKHGVTFSPYMGCRVMTKDVLAQKMKLWTGLNLGDFSMKYGEQNPTVFAEEGLYAVQFGGVESNIAKILEINTEGEDRVFVKYTSSGVLSDTWFTKYGSYIGNADYMIAGLRFYEGRFIIESNKAYTEAPAIPSEAELENAMLNLFNTPGFNGLLFTDFTDINDANIWQVVAQIQDGSFTGNIKEEYIQHGFDYFDDTGCNVVSAKVLKESLMLWTNNGDPSSFKGDPTYFLVTDIYAVQFGGVEINPVKILGVRYDKADDLYYVRYTANGLVSDHWFTKYGNYIGVADEMQAALRLMDGRFVLVSNQVLWSESDKTVFPDYIKALTQKNLMAKGFNGILHSIFTADKITTLSMWDVVSQYDDAYEGDIAAAYKAAGLEYSADIGTKLVFAQHLADDIYGFTGWDLSDHLANTSKQPDVLGAVGLFAAQRGDVYHFLVKIHEITYKDGVYSIIITNGEDLESARCAEVTLRWDGSFRIISNTVSPLGAPGNDPTDPESNLYPEWQMAGDYFNDPYKPTVLFKNDGTFVYHENCLAGMFDITGTYTEYADAIVCAIEHSVPNGFAGDDLKSITFEKDDAHLVLKTDICGSRSGSIFMPVFGRG